MDSDAKNPEIRGGIALLPLPKASATSTESRVSWPRRACDLPQQETSPSAAVVAPKPKRLRILLVDDTYSNRRFVELILSHLGHDVVSVADGNAAIEMARDGAWDVILMDLQMPRMNGWETTATIRRQEQAEGRPHIPIIALTAYTIAGNRERSFRAGMDEFLTKPIDPEMLSNAVQRHARRRPK
jgi:CheY-like chemotaxis protein